MDAESLGWFGLRTNKGTTKMSKCPFAKSDMTPCYIRDGKVVIITNSRGTQLCVGCDKPISYVKQPVRKGTQQWTPSGN